MKSNLNKALLLTAIETGINNIHILEAASDKLTREEYAMYLELKLKTVGDIRALALAEKANVTFKVNLESYKDAFIWFVKNYISSKRGMYFGEIKDANKRAKY